MSGSRRGVIGVPEHGVFLVRFLTCCLVHGFLLSCFTERLRKMTHEPNKSLQATATALVSRTGAGNMIVTVAVRSQSPVAVPELGR